MFVDNLVLTFLSHCRISLPTFKAGINNAQSVETFEDSEVTAMLTYLQNVGKVMVDSGVIYRI